MSLKFYPLQVTEVVRETADAYTIRFAIPDREAFVYQAGQYLTLKIYVNGENLRRAYSLSSSPDTDKDLAVTIKRVRDGKVSSFLHQNLKAGQTIESYPPLGSFKLAVDAKNARHYVLVGAGSGITPLMSMLKSVLAKEPQSVVTLVYGNRDENSVIFKQQLDALVAGSGGRLRVVHVLSQPSATYDGSKGRIEGQNARILLQDALQNRSGMKVEAYLCGPAAMMEAAAAALKALNVAESAIHRELYTAALPAEEETDDNFSYERTTRKVTVILDGEKLQVTVKPNKSILGALIDLDKDPPYACLEGLCATCRGKVHSGVVEMDEREGLSDEEVEAGYVLTCQSHPLSDNVVVEFA